MKKEFKVIAIIAAAILFVGFHMLPQHLTPVSVDPHIAALYDTVKNLDPEMVAMAQVAPASAVPANPSSVYGAAFTSNATTTGAGAMSMQIYKATGNVSVSATGLNTMYVYWAACLNTSATAVGATLKDGTAVAGYVPCPASAASMGTTSFNPPIRITPGVTPTLTATTAESTLYFMLGGYMDNR